MAKSNKNVLKHKKSLLALIIIVVLIAGYWIYGQVSTYTNKRDFQQAREAIDSIYKNVSKSASIPDNYSRNNVCARSYQELSGYGEITCDVETSFIYAVPNKAEAQDKINLIQKNINQKAKTLKPTKPINTNIETTGVVSKDYYGAQNFYKYGSLDCTSKYVYNTPDDTFLKLKSPGIPLYVVIGCTGPAKKLYYPLNQ